MPETVPIASSSFSVISDSISSGAAPLNRVVTCTIGMSIFGNRSTPSFA